jgi:hypothetical protein
MTLEERVLLSAMLAAVMGCGPDWNPDVGPECTPADLPALAECKDGCSHPERRARRIGTHPTPRLGTTSPSRSAEKACHDECEADYGHSCAGPLTATKAAE